MACRFTTLGMLFVLLGGALVTKTESGMGCGRSWPLCNGQLIPSDITFEFVIELAHRVVSGGVGLLVVDYRFGLGERSDINGRRNSLSALSFFFLVFKDLLELQPFYGDNQILFLALILVFHLFPLLLSFIDTSNI